MTAEYLTLRGVHLLRTRIINASGLETLMRPNPSFLKISQVKSSGISRSNAPAFILQGRVCKLFRGTAQYALSGSNDDVLIPS